NDTPATLRYHSKARKHVCRFLLGFERQQEEVSLEILETNMSSYPRRGLGLQKVKGYSNSFWDEVMMALKTRC
ncbi:hypothetical protein PSY31_23900, partial [Shigella flexneri]|nr:hypothetical protein [Shigella flexneri]